MILFSGLKFKTFSVGHGIRADNSYNLSCWLHNPYLPVAAVSHVYFISDESTKNI